MFWLLRMDLTDAVFITQEQDEQLRRADAVQTMLFSQSRVIPGSAAVVMDSDLPLNINRALCSLCNPRWLAPRIRCSGDQGPPHSENCRSTDWQLEVHAMRWTIHPFGLCLSRPSICQRGWKVGKTVSRANVAMCIAEQLTKAAELLVECLIERCLTEAELSLAQSRLEQNDTGADRAILRSRRRDWMSLENRRCSRPGPVL